MLSAMRLQGEAAPDLATSDRKGAEESSLVPMSEPASAQTGCGTNQGVSARRWFLPPFDARGVMRCTMEA